MPGGIADEVDEIRIAVESERIPGALAAQTPGGFPRAHLRMLRPDGTIDPRGTTEIVAACPRFGACRSIHLWALAMAEGGIGVEQHPHLRAW